MSVRAATNVLSTLGLMAMYLPFALAFSAHLLDLHLVLEVVDLASRSRQVWFPYRLPRSPPVVTGSVSLALESSAANLTPIGREPWEEDLLFWGSASNGSNLSTPGLKSGVP